MRNRFLILLLLLYPGVAAYGNIIPVTSNADDGPGSLRDALRLAAANGTASTDSIVFRLPDHSQPGRTIGLLSSLPDLSSNLLIDGSTQNGLPFGNSGARVCLENITIAEGYTCFRAVHARNIQIHGLFMKGILGYAFYALYMRDVSHVYLGAPGKGNVLQGFGQAVFADFFTGEPASDSLFIQSNFFGTDVYGDTLSQNTINNTNISLTHVRNVFIGGNTAAYGNVIAGGNNVLTVSYIEREGGVLQFSHNHCNTDRAGMKTLITYPQSDIYIWGVNDGAGFEGGTTDVNLIFTQNILSARLELVKIRTPFKITANHFGVAADHITPLQRLYQCLLMFKFCGDAVVGGNDPADRNYFAYADGGGICEFHTGNTTITRNSFFCHTQPGIQIWAWDFSRFRPFVTVNSINAGTVRGTAPPGSIVELFEDDDCPGCQGKTYIGSTSAVADGSWQFSGLTSSNIVATATDTEGATSPFSEALIDTSFVQLKAATCGSANGYIKQMRIISGTQWHWENEAGQVVGTDTNLLNLPPGRYRLVVGISNSNCRAVSNWYEIKAVSSPAPFDQEGSGLTINHPTCGLFNGSMAYSRPFNDSLLYRWVTSSGMVICQDFTTTNPATGFPPGDYYMELRLKADSSCAVRNGPYPMVNSQGPQLNTNQPLIQHATCGRPNGNITGIRLQGATGPVTYYWLDGAGNLVVNTPDLLNVPPGRYQLRCKDQSSCDTIITTYYVINNLGIITIDSSAVIIQTAPCSGPGGGSVSGLRVTGASQYNWINESTGALAGNSLDLQNVIPGSYRLELSNAEGCTKTTGPFIVTPTGFLPFTADSVQRIDASCNLSNGSLTLISYTPQPLSHGLRWLNSSGTQVSNAVTASGLAAGTYRLEATDQNGCSQVIFTASLLQLGKPAFDYRGLVMTPDTCSLNTGALRGLMASGGLSPLTWAWYLPDGRLHDFNAGNLYRWPAGVYKAQVTDANGCRVISDPLTIESVSFPLPAPVVQNLQVPRHTPATIRVVNPVTGIYDLRSDPLLGNILLASAENGVLVTPPVEADSRFEVVLRSGTCSSTRTLVEVKVIDATELFIPGAFSPNNDSRNDYWHITVKGILTRFSLVVYNRWGEPVYSSDDPLQGWDGRLNGKPLSPGTYVYTIRATDIRNRVIEKRGSVVIIR